MEETIRELANDRKTYEKEPVICTIKSTVISSAAILFLMSRTSSPSLGLCIPVFPLSAFYATSSLYCITLNTA